MICPDCGYEGRTEGQPCSVCQRKNGEHNDAHDAATAVRTGDTPTSSPRMHANNSLEIGGMFANRYRIIRMLGRGGMGAVFEVVDAQTKKRLALKVLHSDVSATGAYERFKREVETLSRVKHPAVPQVYGWGVEYEGLYFCCDLIDGDNLRAIVKKNGLISLEEAVSISATVADALHAAHLVGIAHRDVKPHNIMLGPNREVSLLDFGVARSTALEMKPITMTGMIIGTPEYMSPEQFEGRRIDRRSDIYSLGIVLFELVTGKLPFTADSAVALAIKHQNDPPPEPRHINSATPAWLERIILRCLEKDPQKRYLTAEELAQDLRKPRKGSRQSKLLPSGDRVVIDDSESEQWALVLVTRREKRGWTLDMALDFNGQYYRLDDFETDGQQRWTYRFSHWPSERIFRKLVNYDEDLQMQVEKPTLGKKMKGWFGMQ
jgi:serine/threonine-protein kinase